MSAEFDSHEGRSLEEIVEYLADELCASHADRNRIVNLLIEFAEEIKRQAVEP